jgi:hypothetical protein
MVAMKEPSAAAFPVGRFTGWEPLGFEAGDNDWYRFVANGPTGKVDPNGLQGVPPQTAPEGIAYLPPDAQKTTVVADGKGGLAIQVKPTFGQRFKNQKKIVELARQHEQIHIDDLVAINRTPSIDTAGKPVPARTLITFSRRSSLGKSELKAIDHTIAGLQAIRKAETDRQECERLGEYIRQLEVNRKIYEEWSRR